MQLLEELLGAHARADQVDGEPDGEHELFQERELHGGELVERAELYDTSQLILEKDRVDGQIPGRRLPQA